MGDSAVDARIVEAPASVSTGNDAVNARIAEALASVSTGNSAVHARIAEALASVSTGNDAVCARIVEALKSVVTGNDAVHARGIVVGLIQYARMEKTIRASVSWAVLGKQWNFIKEKRKRLKLNSQLCVPLVSEVVHEAGDIKNMM